MRDANGFFDEIHVRTDILHAYPEPTSGCFFDRVVVIGDSGIDRSQLSERMHNNFIGAESEQGCSAVSAVWNKDAKRRGKLSEQSHEPPWNCTASTVATE